MERLKGVELINQQFNDLLAECLKNGDRVNAARCLENKAKHEGYYQADNEQKQESSKLSEQQRKDQDDYNAWKRRQLLKQA